MEVRELITIKKEYLIAVQKRNTDRRQLSGLKTPQRSITHLVISQSKIIMSHDEHVRCGRVVQQNVYSSVRNRCYILLRNVCINLYAGDPNDLIYQLKGVKSSTGYKSYPIIKHFLSFK